MTRADVEIRFLAADDWRLLRAARLRALRDSPQAFTSRYSTESVWTEQQWRSRFIAAEWLAAVEPGGVIGIAGLADGRPAHAQHHIESIWVAPEHRRQGVFQSLITTLADRSRRSGHTELLLWVLEGNLDAVLAYRRLGFIETGERGLTGPHPHQYERRLRLPL
ncbi:MAG: GNAT family N-acetyltransferase [Pseudonocardiales bacterium]|nr:GNAT family N-acetyltransferase [Pseudonocardiales bacterium]